MNICCGCKQEQQEKFTVINNICVCPECLKTALKIFKAIKENV